MRFLAGMDSVVSREHMLLIGLVIADVTGERQDPFVAEHMRSAIVARIRYSVAIKKGSTASI